MTTTYTIRQLTGAHIREAMRSADSAKDAEETLRRVAQYTGIGETVETQADGSIVLLDGERVVAVAALREDA